MFILCEILLSRLNRRRIFIPLLTTMIGVNLSFSQKERVEIRLMNCWYDALEDKAKEVKKIVNNYNTLLIDEGILIDTTAKSYRLFFNSIAKGKAYNSPSVSFNAKLDKLELTLNNYEECIEAAIKDTLNFDSLKFHRHNFVFDSIMGLRGNTRADLAKGVLSVLDEKDFELNYYKIRTFLIYEYIILGEIWNVEQPESPINKQK